MHYTFIQKCKIFFQGFGKYFVALGILGAITSSMGLIEPILDANIITSLTTFHIEKAIFLALLLLLLRLTVQLLHYLTNVLFSKIKFKCILNIRMKVCHAYLQIKSKVLDQKESGIFLERIKNDPSDITELFGNIQDYVIGIITNVGVIFYVYWIHPMIGLCYTLSILCLISIQKCRIAVLTRRRRENKKINEENATVLNNLIQGTKEIKQLNFKTTYLSYVENTFDKNFKKRLETNRETYQYQALYYSIKAFLSFMILLVGGYFVIQGSLSITNLLILWMYRNNVYTFAINSSNLAEKLSTFNVYAERVLELMDSPQYEQESYGTENPQKLIGEIQFQNVSFSYLENPILRNVNFQVSPNQTVAFVGKSGSGKTTIFNLLSKLYDANEGKIFIDHYPIDALTEDSIRNNIAVVGQNPYLFHLTIKENIMLANPNLKLKELKEICRQVCLDELIENLPQKYDTILGEGGVNLSGGEKQRLAIARALAKKTPIILLDEATSALDNTTQMHIQRTLKNIREDKTIIMIAHRLSTIIDCDKIYVINDGKLVAEGTHENLLKTSTIYKELYNQEN